MSALTQENIVSAYETDHLVQIVEANEYGPPISEEMAERIIDIAARRTQARSAHSMDAAEKDYLVTTTWDNFCRDTFGSDDVGAQNVPNRFALVVPDFETSKGNDAWLCTDAVVVQHGWLTSGDGRRTDIKEVDQTHTSYHDDRGEFWCPKAYTALFGFGDELVRDEAKAVDAM